VLTSLMTLQVQAGYSAASVMVVRWGAEGGLGHQHSGLQAGGLMSPSQSLLKGMCM
jgi:hypothetical protein